MSEPKPETCVDNLRTRPSMAQKTADKALTIFDETCTKLNIPYFLRAGTCLGFYREGKHIEWAGDIDIGVICTKIQKLWNELKKNGFLTGYGNEVPGRHILIDIGYAFNEYKLKYLKTFDTVTYKKKKHNTPHPVEEYLEYRYGTQWKTPKAPYDGKLTYKQRTPTQALLMCFPQQKFP